MTNLNHGREESPGEAATSAGTEKSAHFLKCHGPQTGPDRREAAIQSMAMRNRSRPTGRKGAVQTAGSCPPVRFSSSRVPGSGITPAAGFINPQNADAEQGPPLPARPVPNSTQSKRAPRPWIVV